MTSCHIILLNYFTYLIRGYNDNNNVTNKQSTTMKRIKYIQSIELFLLQNPEVIIQNVMPQCILDEVYYFQRCQYKLLQT